MTGNAILTRNPMGPNQAIFIDPELCVSCYQCAEVCRVSVILENPKKDKPPMVVYPDECWFCGCCTINCPTGAIRMENPMNQKIGYKRKETGEIFRFGMKNPPSPNTKLSVGDDRERLPESKKIELEVMEIKQAARFVIRCRLGNREFDSTVYKPGHFCNILVGENVYRAYSIANKTGSGYLEFYIDTFPGGPGVHFFKTLKKGDTVKLIYPMGRFVYKPSDTPVLLIGSVTGIAPVKAMIETELEQFKSGRKVQLIFAVWDKEDIFLKEQFDELERRHSNFSYVICLSNSCTKAEKTGKIYNGTISEFIKKEVKVTWGLDTYICGSKELINVVERDLIKCGAFWKNIHYESITH
jgi:ferredoxin-NADP reductase/NAD-dependent dihydropyrimidine dehydrogenase PreA subunit